MVLTSPGQALKTLVNDGAHHRDKISKSLQSDGVPQNLINDLLGPATEIPVPEHGTPSLPAITELLNLGYSNASEVRSAPAMHSVLSQFVHATPISNWHIRRDIFPTLTAPAFAISLESAARGFERIALITLLLAGVSRETLDEPLNALSERCAQITTLAALYHFLG